LEAEVRSFLKAVAVLVFLFAVTDFVNASGGAQSMELSPGWAGAVPAGPDTKVKMTEAYIDLVTRDAYFWAWPMVDVYNRRQAFKQLTEPVMLGPVPAAPLNRLGMLTDYIVPEERIVACPNQDVVYGAGSLALDLSPVVIQVPDFSDRFWVYQIIVFGCIRLLISAPTALSISARCTPLRLASIC
jgi:hypothetical protein